MNGTVEVTGTIWGVFAHRFALETPEGKVLADIGPHHGEHLLLVEGERVTVRGDRKPSEIKAELVVTADGTHHRIERPKKPEHDAHAPADPEVALQSVRADGYAAAGEPKRKPKHWEIRATRGERAYELHVELNGRIRLVKDLPLAPAA